eukprot:tig00000455_g1036.t1
MGTGSSSPDPSATASCASFINANPSPGRVATFFEHINCQGTQWGPRSTWNEWVGSAENDKYSTACVAGGRTLTMWDNWKYDPQSEKMWVGTDSVGYKCINLPDYRFNDRVSSYKIEQLDDEPQLRVEEEYRPSGFVPAEEGAVAAVAEGDVAGDLLGDNELESDAGLDLL